MFIIINNDNEEKKSVMQNKLGLQAKMSQPEGNVTERKRERRTHTHDTSIMEGNA